MAMGNYYFLELAQTHVHCQEGNGTPLQYSCLENPMGRRSLVGCRLQGHQDWVRGWGQACAGVGPGQGLTAALLHKSPSVPRARLPSKNNMVGTRQCLPPPPNSAPRQVGGGAWPQESLLAQPCNPGSQSLPTPALGTTGSSGSLSCGAREVRSPCTWRGGAWAAIYGVAQSRTQLK